jgi:hypothetical protein
MSTLAGCYYDTEDLIYPSSQPTACDTNGTTFSGSVSGIISQNCATSGCHSNGNKSPDLSSYSTITSNISRVKARAIDDKTMPPSGALHPCDILKLQDWINQGTPNN